MQSTVALPMSVPTGRLQDSEASFFRNVKGTLCWVVGHADLLASAGVLRHPLFGQVEFVIGVPEEDAAPRTGPSRSA
jgi:hypothetical protein